MQRLTYSIPVEEVSILRDMNCKIRFRLGGEQFPPKIMYKIFIDKGHVCNLSPRKLIEPGTKVHLGG
jgi:hypothetical protein